MEIKKTIICLFLITTIETCVFGDYLVIKIFDERKIDISSKSYMGWARVLNNPTKRKEYNLDDLNQNIITILTGELKNLSEENSFGGKLK